MGDWSLARSHLSLVGSKVKDNFLNKLSFSHDVRPKVTEKNGRFNVSLRDNEERWCVVMRAHRTSNASLRIENKQEIEEKKSPRKFWWHSRQMGFADDEEKQINENSNNVLVLLEGIRSLHSLHFHSAPRVFIFHSLFTKEEKIFPFLTSF
jgi:hypothetical protein